MPRALKSLLEKETLYLANVQIIKCRIKFEQPSHYKSQQNVVSHLSLCALKTVTHIY